MELLNDEVLGVENVGVVLVPFLENVEVTSVVDNRLCEQRHHASLRQRVVD